MTEKDREIQALRREIVTLQRSNKELYQSYNRAMRTNAELIKQLAEVKYISCLDKSEVVKLRRQIEMLMEEL